jgi:anti-sigma factor RsiW
MTCSRDAEVFSSYVDGEFDADERADLEQHLRSCAECGKRVEGLRALKHAVGRLEGRASPSEAVQARVAALRFRLEASRRPRFGRVALAVALAAAIAAALLAIRIWRGSPAASLSEGLIADHLRYVPEAMPAEVASHDPAEVRRFFAGKLPFEPVVPELGPAELLGGRVCKIDGRKVALLFYQLEHHKLSLYVSDRPAESSGCQSARQHNVCTHGRGALSLMLVGAASDRELQALLESAAL